MNTIRRAVWALALACGLGSVGCGSGGGGFTCNGVSFPACTGDSVCIGGPSGGSCLVKCDPDAGSACPLGQTCSLHSTCCCGTACSAAAFFVCQ